MSTMCVYNIPVVHVKCVVVHGNTSMMCMYCPVVSFVSSCEVMSVVICFVVIVCSCAWLCVQCGVGTSVYR